jgi:outer membrane protein, multidrug efflux system
MMTWPQVCASLLLLAGISGCVVGPNYQPPQIPVPSAWSEGQLHGAEARAAATAQWWTTFKDPGLEALIGSAVQSNLDLRTAAARVREARAQRGIVAGDLWPTINVSGSYTRQQRSENVVTLPSGAVSSGTGGGGNLTQDLFQTGFDATWEIDLFGGVRRSIEAADADLAASQEALRYTLVSLLAEAAR